MKPEEKKTPCWRCGKVHKRRFNAEEALKRATLQLQKEIEEDLMISIINESRSGQKSRRKGD